MPIVLYRVDERLIHGQVVVGWGAVLDPDRIVVVDDVLARSPWEQELYDLGLPPELETDFADIETARRRLGEWRESPERAIVLTRDVGTMRRLGQDGLLRGEEVNIGGIHFAQGRERALPYVYLGPAEREEIERLADEGAEVAARDLPGSRRVALPELLRAGGRAR
ncbi:MAG: PTS system mannose/fructose/N-acetylgalactosamine-transporter subunit IIB [Gemmatimonadota bacterium]